MFPGQREASHRGRVECGGAPEPAGGGQPPHAGGGGHVRRVSRGEPRDGGGGGGLLARSVQGAAVPRPGAGPRQECERRDGGLGRCRPAGAPPRPRQQTPAPHPAAGGRRSEEGARGREGAATGEFVKIAKRRPAMAGHIPLSQSYGIQSVRKKTYVDSESKGKAECVTNSHEHSKAIKFKKCCKFGQ